MPDSLFKQIQYEKDAWKDLVYYLMEENARLKTRLADILKNRSDFELVDSMDTFQNQFIHLDHLLSVLRNHLSDMDGIITQHIKGPADGENLKRKLIVTRIMASNIEQQFIESRNEFYHKLLHLLEPSDPTHSRV